MAPAYVINYVVIILALSSSIIQQTDSAQPTISISPTTLAKSGDSVSVRWSNVPSPSPLDWLGIYSPTNSSHKYFIGYFFLTSSPGWESGSGNLTFPLVNLRSDYEFRIFRWTEDEVDMRKHDHDGYPLPGTRHLLARSGRVGFGGVGVEQVHLAYTEAEDEMRVMFVSGDGEERFVKWWGVAEGGEVEGEVGRTTVERFEREDMCDWPANNSLGWRDPGFVHDGVMKGLKKGERYYYKVGSDSKGWTRTYTFVSRNEDSNETIAFLFGDMGAATPYRTFRRTQDESIATMKWISRDIAALGDKHAFVSHIGDISYARGYLWIWDEFFSQIEPVASQVPYHVCIGNHEYDWPSQPWKPDWAAGVYGKDGGGECGVPYSLKFHMPSNFSEPTGTRAPATRNLVFSHNSGPVHFLYLSTETDFLSGSRQYEFIKRDLESVNRTKTPFVVVQGHRPMYTTSNEVRDAPMRQKMLEHLEPLLVKNNVTIAFWGHVHRYERFCPLNNYACGGLDVNDKGTLDGYVVHVVIGMAGQDWQPIWEPRADHPLDPIFPQPKRSLYRGGEFGYTRLTATKEKLTLSYVGNHDGEVHDMMEILATGEVLNGGNVERNSKVELVNSPDKTVAPQSDSESSFPWKKSTPLNSWTPVKNEETIALTEVR
uniref:Purple acid phosphatase n=1 Tax=Kalanchoe fedtschenkoi TaxID=63787 RepID=A0A7N1A309_KALFE